MTPSTSGLWSLLGGADHKMDCTLHFGGEKME
jgi:hypothetical protein